MTTAPDHDALVAGARASGVDASAFEPLHQHATNVYVAREAGVVLRITDSARETARASTAVAVTSWLSRQGFPATEPLDIEQPLTVGGHTVTSWRYYPQDDRPAPGAGRLGGLLRELHALPEPPVELPEYRPLTSLGNTLANCRTALSTRDRDWLQERRETLLQEYDKVGRSPLGYGFIHGDAYPGNTLWDGQTARIGDWDEAARGPRVLDLVNTYQGRRVGRSDTELQAFTDAYGWDITKWSGFPVLREMRDVHTLGAFIRRADRGDHAAKRELDWRVQTLREGNTNARWNTGVKPDFRQPNGVRAERRSSASRDSRPTRDRDTDARQH